MKTTHTLDDSEAGKIVRPDRGKSTDVWKDRQATGALAGNGLSASEDIVLASLGVDLVSRQRE